MTRKDVIDNIMATYRKYGFTRQEVEEQVKGGEARGFSYQTIYTGLRMAFGGITGEEEHFTVQEMAEALGETEENIVKQIEEMREQIREAGGNPDEYAQEIGPGGRQRFIIPPGALS